MPKGVFSGAKRGPYKKTVISPEQHAVLKANCENMTVPELAKLIGKTYDQTSQYMVRNKIPRLKVGKKYKPEQVEVKKIDFRAAFTNYSNKASTYDYETRVFKGHFNTTGRNRMDTAGAMVSK